MIKSRLFRHETMLATLALYRGLAEGIRQARSVRGYPDWFYVLGQGNLAGVPTQLWLLILVAVIAAILLGTTRIGRTDYAIGSNEVAARFSGRSIDRSKIAVYTASGFAAALAGVIFVSRVSTTRSDMGTGLELDAITVVVLGGISIFGGRGGVIGTLIGLVSFKGLRTGFRWPASNQQCCGARLISAIPSPTPSVQRQTEP
ncbi:ABC transporter permease [Rhizobium sp.]|jgi:rhamnose transport system permease protein|uniref:ABC transporter permease n=1 Tax=Rhizobium sp. TaxID=391 RepID=UPI002AA93F9F